jgi:hypothetical protein
VLALKRITGDKDYLLELRGRNGTPPPLTFSPRDRPEKLGESAWKIMDKTMLSQIADETGLMRDEGIAPLEKERPII